MVRLFKKRPPTKSNGVSFYYVFVAKFQIHPSSTDSSLSVQVPAENRFFVVKDLARREGETTLSEPGEANKRPAKGQMNGQVNGQVNGRAIERSKENVGDITTGEGEKRNQWKGTAEKEKRGSKIAVEEKRQNETEMEKSNNKENENYNNIATGIRLGIRDDNDGEKGSRKEDNEPFLSLRNNDKWHSACDRDDEDDNQNKCAGESIDTNGKIAMEQQPQLRQLQQQQQQQPPSQQKGEKGKEEKKTMVVTTTTKAASSSLSLFSVLSTSASMQVTPSSSSLSASSLGKRKGIFVDSCDNINNLSTIYEGASEEQQCYEDGASTRSEKGREVKRRLCETRETIKASGIDGPTIKEKRPNDEVGDEEKEEETEEKEESMKEPQQPQILNHATRRCRRYHSAPIFGELELCISLDRFGKRAFARGREQTHLPCIQRYSEIQLLRSWRGIVRNLHFQSIQILINVGRILH